MTMTIDASATVPESAAPQKRRHWGRVVLVLMFLLVAGIVYWADTYNPLVQSWHQSQGEWGSYVGTLAGAEAHYTVTDSSAPMATQAWSEPTGVFRVQVETEITNAGSQAVRVVAVGTPDTSYRIEDYRVSFYANTGFPHEDGATFHPFTLAGHSQRRVVVSYTQACTTTSPTSENGHALLSGPTALPVTFSFFGLAHEDWVPIAPFTLTAPRIC